VNRPQSRIVVAAFRVVDQQNRLRKRRGAQKSRVEDRLGFKVFAKSARGVLKLNTGGGKFPFGAVFCQDCLLSREGRAGVKVKFSAKLVVPTGPLRNNGNVQQWLNEL